MAIAISCAKPQVASAAGSATAPVESELPAPPPPASAAPSPNGPLPPPPAPRAAAVPPATAGAAATPGAQASARPGELGSDLPPLPRPPLGARLHDGFYLRMGAGFTLGGGLVSSDSKSVGDYSFAGGGIGLDLEIGGTPTPGLAMGAALFLEGLGSHKRSVDGQRVNEGVSASPSMLAYFVDVFPDPERGAHFGGALGLATARVEVDNGGSKFEGGGLGLQAWGGYDFWVSSQWSLGLMLRFAGSVMRQDDAGVSYQATLGTGTLSFTALYH
ncbi:MAG TPA: hypothetical protein VER96_07290 [Polyangiaceae bacterium]|nr:hypothetical protein [Polyangiaceae bacterium]